VNSFGFLTINEKEKQYSPFNTKQGIKGAEPINIGKQKTDSSLFLLKMSFRIVVGFAMAGKWLSLNGFQASRAVAKNTFPFCFNSKTTKLSS
jgi:hypothetical protein